MRNYENDKFHLQVLDGITRLHNSNNEAKLTPFLKIFRGPSQHVFKTKKGLIITIAHQREIFKPLTTNVSLTQKRIN